LATQWRALESDMQTLKKSFGAEEVHATGFLQLRTSPVAKADEKPKAEPKAKSNASAAKLSAKSVNATNQQAAKPSLSEPATDRLAAAQSMMKGLTGKAMLAPMLGMLNSMYDDQKKRIGDLNKREQKSKDRFAKQQSEFDARIKDITTRHANHKLSDEFFKNETHDYTRQFKYWQGVRERNHRQFHNALKITHGMMQREKDMISKYEAAMTMKTAEDTKKKAPAAPVEAPDVVFVQQRKATAAFIQENESEVRRSLAEALFYSVPRKSLPYLGSIEVPHRH